MNVLTLMPLGRGALVGCVGRPTGVSSALLNGCGSGTANPYRSYSSAEQIAQKRTPPVSTRLEAIASEDTDEELPGMVGLLARLSRAPCGNASPFITWTVMKASHAKGLNSEVAKGDTLAIPWA